MGNAVTAERAKRVMDRLEQAQDELVTLRAALKLIHITAGNGIGGREDKRRLCLEEIQNHAYHAILEMRA